MGKPSNTRFISEISKYSENFLKLFMHPQVNISLSSFIYDNLCLHTNCGICNWGLVMQPAKGK
jgi:hypothetical protein